MSDSDADLDVDNGLGDDSRDGLDELDTLDRSLVEG